MPGLVRVLIRARQRLTRPENAAQIVPNGPWAQFWQDPLSNEATPLNVRLAMHS